MSGKYQIAELNIARIISPLTDPAMKEFVDNLEKINVLAESSDGFVWRLKDEATGDATMMSTFEDADIIVNLSVWQDIKFLKAYVYQSQHANFLKRRKEWFNLMKRPYFAMWWIRRGHQPTIDEARERLEYLQLHGNTPYAFNSSGNYTWQEAEKLGERG